jgi:starch-binding outer membrane protein, SusD/RagB family
MMPRRLSAAALVVALLGMTGCEFDLVDTNGPNAIGPNPSRSQVAASATGLFIATRTYYPQWILNSGILGREAYRFDGSEPRYTTEALSGVLDGGGFIGGSQWAGPYRAIRSANDLLQYVGGAQNTTAAEIEAVKGFAHTFQALNFLNVLAGHTEDSIPIAVGTDPTAPPAPFVTNAAAYANVDALLDQGLTELQNGGPSFPFDLTSGFADFSTPTEFIKFNRALRARAAAYQQNWNGVLTALAGSFIDTLTAPLDLGAYHTFSTGSGDETNSINQATAENYAHPQLRDSAQTNGLVVDLRFTSKTFPRTSNTTNGLTSDLGWARYPSPSSPIPIIRNEELVLLRAEANIQLNNLAQGRDDLNYVRVHSGGLAAYAPFATQGDAINAMLYERRYSLLFEWGHRWIDMRRYGRLNQLPLDRAGDVVHPTFPIPTDEVLARQ